MASALVRNVVTKQAGDTVRLRADFGDCPELWAGATITACTISASVPSGVANSGKVVGTYAVSALFTSGVAGTDYDITFTATFSDGTIVQRVVTLKVVA